MRAFAAVFTREVFERRMVFLVGLCCGIPTLVASALHGWNTPGNADVRLLAASVGGLALAVALALLYGGSMIPGETAEKRISFWFSRPIPAAAIWAGKLLAAVFVSFGAGLLVFLPGALTGPAHPSSLWGFDATVVSSMAVGLAAVVACVLVAHAFATVARLRSPWAFLDLAFAVAFTFAGILFVRTLSRDATLGDPTYGESPQPVFIAVVVLGAAAALAFFLAPLSQVAAGRTDARRAHGAFSLVLWGVTGLGILFVGAFTWWCSSAKASDLTRLVGTVSAPARGTWIVVGGPLSGRRGGASFLVDTASGRSIRVHGWGETFSRDGARAAWGEPDFGLFERTSNRTEVMVADLASGRVFPTGLPGRVWEPLSLSPSGRKIALRGERSVTAYDLSDSGNPKQVAAFAVNADGRALEFVDEDTIRLFPRFMNAARRADLPPAALEIAEFSLPSKKSAVTGRFDKDSLPWLRLTADGRYFLGTRRAADDAQAPASLSLHDGRTGALLATLAEALKNAQARFVSGNRLVVAGIADGKARALFFESEKGWGAPTRTVDLGPATRIALGGEIAPGRVAVSLITLEENLPATRRAATLVAVDAASGEVSRLGEDLVPVRRFNWWLDPAMPPGEAGAPWTSLFLDADGRLVRLDPATGGRTVLLGRSK